jgi:NAD(P)H dehydrogenase (quinone)
MKRIVMVTGASGHLGRRAVELLVERGDRVIAGTRHPEKMDALVARGAAARRVDFDDLHALAVAFDGVERVLLVSTDAIDRPHHRIEQHQHAIDAANLAGVRHVVYTSLSATGPGSPITNALDHRATEAALAGSGFHWTALRNNLYADSLLEPLARAVTTGRLVAAAGDGGAAYITRDDCARAAVAALVADRPHAGAVEIAGPDVVTHEDLAALASEISGVPVMYVPVPPEALRDSWIARELPTPAADLAVSFDLAIAEGLLAVRSDAFEELTGRPPVPLRKFLADNAKVLLAAAERRHALP